MQRNLLEKNVRDLGFVAGKVTNPSGTATLSLQSGGEVDAGYVTISRSSAGVIVFTITNWLGPKSSIVPIGITPVVTQIQSFVTWSYSGSTATITVTTENNSGTATDATFYFAFLAY